MSFSTVPSGPVTGLGARNINATIVELSWGPVMARDQNGIISSYNIYYQQNDSISSGYFIIPDVTERVRILLLYLKTIANHWHKANTVR